MDTLEDIVAAYSTIPSSALSARSRLNGFLKWFASSKRQSIDEVIEAAVLRNHPHQNCLSRKKREIVAANLKARRTELLRGIEFVCLFELVEGAVRPPFVKADLLVYDIALRIGAYLGSAPKTVYLHSGALTGALAVLGKHPLPRNLVVEAFPEGLRSLAPHELEDCLCIHKDDFLRLAA